MGRHLDEKNLARIDGLRPLAGDLGISMAQLALAWCLTRPEVASLIIGVTRAAQLDENTKASEIRLPSDVLSEIDRLFPPGSSLPMPTESAS
jgi:aryl-alcohol dehydrogenase-like predicted oxidoreductase